MRFVFVLGPTGSGKTKLALQLAEKWGGEIINCDSVQVYEGLVIGAAQPSLKERQQRPHHLYGYVPQGTELTVGQYHRDFYSLIRNLNPTGLYFVVGGTGFYVQALEKGLLPIAPSDEKTRMDLETELQKEGGAARLYQQLIEKDPRVAQRIHPNDHYRLVRALEIIKREGRNLSEIEADFHSEHKKFQFAHLKVGIDMDRDVLRSRVRSRTLDMLSNGLLAETQNCLKAGLKDWKALRSIGYFQAQQHLAGQISESEMVDAIVIATMQFAKRQKTWFKRDQEIHWYTQETFETDIERAVEAWLKKEL